MRYHEAYEFAVAHCETLTIEWRGDIDDAEFDEFIGVVPPFGSGIGNQERIHVRNGLVAKDARRLAAFLRLNVNAASLAEVVACLSDGRWLAEVDDFNETVHRGLNMVSTLEFAGGLERVPEHKHRFENFVHRETLWPGQPGKTQPVHEFVCEVPRCGYRQMIWVDCAAQGCGMKTP